MCEPNVEEKLYCHNESLKIERVYIRSSSLVIITSILDVQYVRSEKPG